MDHLRTLICTLAAYQSIALKDILENIIFLVAIWLYDDS